jgi:hypothetical protein
VCRWQGRLPLVLPDEKQRAQDHTERHYQPFSFGYYHDGGNQKLTSMIKHLRHEQAELIAKVSIGPDRSAGVPNVLAFNAVGLPNCALALFAVLVEGEENIVESAN